MTPTQLSSGRRTAGAATVLRLEEVQRQARLMAGRICINNPDDLAQRATVRYWETFGEGRGPASLQAWLKRTVDGLAANGERRPARRREVRPLPVALTANDADVEQLLRHMANPSQAVVRKELLQRVLSRIERPDLQVLRMRLSGYSSLEVAQSLRTSAMAADQAYARAKRQLKVAIATEPGLLRAIRSGVPPQWRRAS